MKRLWALVGLVCSMGAWAAPEVLVSTPDVKDIEFDSGRDGAFCASCNSGAGNARYVHVTKSGEMWIGLLDPTTGDFIHRDGRGVLVDHNVCGPASVGNGPEWMFSTRGSELTYTRWADGTANEPQNRSLGLARFEQGAWSAGSVVGTQFRQNPGGSLDVGDTAPTVIYTNTARDTLYWRQVGGAVQGENVIPLDYPPKSSITRRFIPGTKSILLTGPAPRDGSGNVYRQVFIYNMDTNELRQLTFDPIDKNSGFMWRAPEFGNRWTFFTVVNNTDIRIYRKLGDDDGAADWELIKTVSSGDDMPFVGSPEYFTHNGKSWIYFWLSEDQSRSTARSRIAMTGIEPAVPSLTLLATDTDGIARSRRDPEHYITAQGPYLYYIRMRVDSRLSKYEGIHRVDTGLGPRAP